MWCEYCNHLMYFIIYTMEGNDDNIYYNTEVGLLAILIWSAIAFVVLIFLSWWLIPLRFLLSHKM